VIGGALAPPRASAPARAAGRWPFAFAPRLFLLLSLGLLWIVPAWVDRRALLAMLFWDVFVLAIWAIDLRRLPAPSDLVIDRAWRATLVVGTPATVELHVRNGGRLPLTVRLQDETAAELRAGFAAVDLEVATGGSATAAYQVEPLQRGDATLGGVAVSYRSPWQLAERWAVAPVSQRVRVYPDLHEARRQSMYLIRSRQVALEMRRARFPGRGREFESLREFRDGDEQRDICWTATARRGKVVAKVYQPERSQAIWLLVDAGRLLRARTGRQSKLDCAVNAALSLAQVALLSGDRVGLLAYGRRPQELVPPARGPRHVRAILDALASVTAETVEADHAAAAGLVRSVQKRRALIVWLTDMAETAGVPEVVERAASLAPHHVVVFAAMRQPDVAALASSTPATTTDMYRVLAAQEALERREVLLRRVRQSGALVLDVAPGELTGALVERYLDVKERNLV
jgi:uncharacterized protein (DUF58 family)